MADYNAPLPTTRPPGLLTPQPWPTAADVAAAREYRQRFGNINEQDINAGLLANVVPAAQAINQGAFTDQRQAPLDKDTADRLYAAQIAAQRSPLGYLGYDVNRMVVSPAGPAIKANYVGEYLPQQDRFWSDLNFPTNPVHESIHRGIELLRRQGTKIDPEMEEAIVRAQMQKYYGKVEKTNQEEIDQGSRMLNSPYQVKVMDEINQKANEAIAQRLIAKQGGVF